MDDFKYVTIFGQKLTGYLLLRGFVLISMKPNNDGSGRNLFFFKDTPEIRKAMSEFKDFKRKYIL